MPYNHYDLIACTIAQLSEKNSNSPFIFRPFSVCVVVLACDCVLGSFLYALDCGVVLSCCVVVMCFFSGDFFCDVGGGGGMLGEQYVSPPLGLREGVKRNQL